MKEDYEFTILFDWYKFPEEDGEKPKLVKRNCKKKWYVSDINNITDLREVPGKNTKPLKNTCEVYNRIETKWVVVQGKYSELLKVIRPNERNKIKGYGI